MATIASKVLADLGKRSRRDGIDLGPLGEAGATPGAAIDMEVDPDLPVGHRYWMEGYMGLARLGFSLLESRHLAKLGERIAASEEVYAPGKPRSPLTDSFHSFWGLADTSLGLKKETLATIAIVVARRQKAAAPLVATWTTMADSYTGLYRVAAIEEPNLVTLTELVTDDTRVVELAGGVPGEVGQIWWTRLLPPAHGENEYWTSIVTPYVFPDQDAEPLWTDYLARQLGDVPAAKRSDAYRRHMKQGRTPTYWLDFIADAHLGSDEVGICLAGVPDIPRSLPGSAAGLAEHEAELATKPANERLRLKLFAYAREYGMADEAEKDFNATRKLVADLPELPVLQWQAVEQKLYLAYALYERPMSTGYGAIDEMAGTPDMLDGEEAAELAMVQAGWFSLFEVASAAPGEGIEVLDVIRGNRLWVSEVSASRTLVAGDCFGAWLLKKGEQILLEGCSGHVPRALNEYVKDALHTVMAELRKDRDLDWRTRQGQLAPWLSAMLGAYELRDRE